MYKIKYPKFRPIGQYINNNINKKIFNKYLF